MNLQIERYLDMLSRVMARGTIIKPRGIEVKEIEDLQLMVDPSWPFMTFEDRKYDVGYFKKEMIWKLGANKYDASIQNHATMWNQIQNPDGTYNSNYGQYWFGEQGGIWSVVTELIRDQDSRRVVIPMLNASHMSPQTIDTVCTECVGFRLRPCKSGLCLNMSIHMRSSDIIYGLGTDIPTFAFLYRLVYGLIKESITLPLVVGTMMITAMSSHIYSKHYVMVNKILENGRSTYHDHKMPFCEYPDALRIIASRGKREILDRSGKLGGWLCM